MKTLVTMLVAASFLIFSTGNANAQSTVPCEDFEFPSAKPSPTTWGDTFELLMFTNCFVYSDAGSSHVVIYPGYWGETPEPDKQALVRFSLTAMQELRATLSAFGQVPRKALLFLTEADIEGADAEMTIIPDPATGRYGCWIVGPSGGWTTSKPRFRQALAHEMSHCMLDLTHSVDHGSDYRGEPEEWFYEAGAEYFGSVVYPGINTEHEYKYQLNLPLVEQSYNAVLFWQFYANNYGGPEAVGRFYRTLERYDQDNHRPLLATRDSFAEVFHSFATTSLYPTVSDPGGGHMPRPKYTQSGYVVNGADGDQIIGPEELPTLTGGIIHLTLKAGYDYVIKEPATTSGQVLASVAAFTDTGIPTAFQPIDKERLIPGACDVDRTVVVMVTSIENTESVNTEFQITPQELEDCSPCPADARDIDRCLHGTWHFDEAAFMEMVEQGKRYIEQHSPDPLPPHTITPVHIDTKTSFCSGARAEGYSDWQVKFSGNSHDGRLRMSGVIDKLDINAGKACVNKAAGTMQLRHDMNEHRDRGSSMTMTAEGYTMSLPIGQSYASPMSSDLDAPLKYRCEGDELIITGEQPDPLDETGTRMVRLDFRFKRLADSDSAQIDHRVGYCIAPE